MKITYELLASKLPCSWGMDWFNSQDTEDVAELVKNAIRDGDSAMNYANWGITRLMTKPQCVQYAIFSAKQVIKIYEDRYPRDDRPRKAIEAAEKYLKEPTEENKNAAYAAAYAYAVAAVHAASDAAYAHAAAAAYAAADASYAAAYAADAAAAVHAAADAAYAAAYAADAADAAYAADAAVVVTRTEQNTRLTALVAEAAAQQGYSMEGTSS